MDRIDWNDISYFLAVCRAGSLSAASRQLGVEHTTVGRRINVLERSLGSRLFDRSRDGYVATSRGAEIRALAEDMEVAADALIRRGGGGDAQIAGTLRITSTETLCSEFLVPTLPRLMSRYPGLRVEVVADNSNLSLARREADMALRMARPEGGSLVTRVVASVGYGVYASKAFCRKFGLEPGNFEPDMHPVVGFDDTGAEFGATRWLSAACAAVGARPVFVSNSLVSQYAAVVGGIGAGVLPSYMAERDKRLVRLLGPRQVISRDLWLVYHRDVRELARLRTVADFVVNEAKNQRALLEGPRR
ncbi:MAG: LysR family transcriptional regulator [Alphaproteobacteria bacterium]|nr:LysR family transcriptional regulator [Alphaproteobacteria bacterium]